MNITVFGASGGVGSHVVSLAVQRGHKVRAVYRSTPGTPPPEPAEILIATDISQPAFARDAVEGANVVVTAIGPNFGSHHNARTEMTSPPDLHQRLARRVIAAMKDSAPSARLIAVSTASMGPADALMGAGPRMLFRFLRTVAVPNLGRIGQDLRAMENELAASGLDWYAVRPVKLSDGPLTGNVRASDSFAMKDISRADVAWQILAIAEEPAPGHHRTPIVTKAASKKSGAVAAGTSPIRTGTRG